MCKSDSVSMDADSRVVKAAQIDPTFLQNDSGELNPGDSVSAGAPALSSMFHQNLSKDNMLYTDTGSTGMQQTVVPLVDEESVNGNMLHDDFGTDGSHPDPDVAVCDSVFFRNTSNNIVQQGRDGSQDGEHITTATEFYETDDESEVGPVGLPFQQPPTTSPTGSNVFGTPVLVYFVPVPVALGEMPVPAPVPGAPTSSSTGPPAVAPTATSGTGRTIRRRLQRKKQAMNGAEGQR